MRGGVTGWGTDEKAIFETLRGKTPDQISELRSNYSEHYRRNLDGDLGKELSGSALERARSLMRSDQAGADAINLRDQISAGWRGDNKEILSTLERASPEQRADIAKAYQQRYGANSPVKDPVNALQRDLQGKLGTREYGQASALLDATRVDSASRAADAHASRAAGEKMQHALSGYFPDKPAVFDSLQQLSPSQRELVAKNPDLMKQMSERLDKPEHDRAMALLRGDQAGATAAQIQTSLGGWLGADKSGLQGLLEGKSPEELRGIQDAYKAQTGKSLDAELAQRMSGKDLEVTRGLLSTGTVPEAQRLDYAMSGAGTDEDAIKRTLAGKTPEQISQIRDDYQRRYGRPLDADLHGELGGRDEFQVDQLLKGKPGSPGDAVLRAEQARDFERGWSSSVFDAANRLFKGEADGARLDRDVAAARQAYGQAMNDGRLTGGERQEVMKKVGFAGEDQKAYQQVKDSGSDAAATGAVAGGTAAAVFFTGGAATPLAIAGYSALGAATRAGVKGALEGQALGGDGLMREGLLGGLEGATAVLPGGAGAGRAGLQTAEAVAAEQAAKSGLSGILRDGLAGGAYSGAVNSAANRATQSETWRNGVLPGLADVTRDGVSGGAMGGATGTAVATATEGARRVLSGLRAPAEGAAPMSTPAAATPSPEDAARGAVPTPTPAATASPPAPVESVTQYGPKDSAVFFLPKREVAVAGETPRPHDAVLMQKDTWLTLPPGVHAEDIPGLRNPQKFPTEGAGPKGGPILVPKGTDVSQLRVQDPSKIVVDGAAPRAPLATGAGAPPRLEGGRHLVPVRDLGLDPTTAGGPSPSANSPVWFPGKGEPVTKPQMVEEWARREGFRTQSSYPQGANVVTVSGHGSVNPDGLAQTLGPRNHVEYYNMNGSVISDTLGGQIERNVADGLRRTVGPGEAVVGVLHPADDRLHINGGAFVASHERLSTNEVMERLRQVYGNDSDLVAKWAACRQDVTNTMPMAPIMWDVNGPELAPGQWQSSWRQTMEGYFTGKNEAAAGRAPVDLRKHGLDAWQDLHDQWRREALTPGGTPRWEGIQGKEVK